MQLLVPASAAVLLDRHAGVTTVLDDCTVRVGTLTELDVATVAEHVGADAAAALIEYWTDTRRLHARRRNGTAGGEDVLVVHSVCRQARQLTGREKQDLRAELDALERLGDETAASLAAGLGPQPDGERLVVVYSLDPVLPECLGGPMRPTEIRRRFELEVRYATWRDRKVRRLAGLRAVAEELWPVPQPATVAGWLSGRS